jgi:hypothetical protein
MQLFDLWPKAPTKLETPANTCGQCVHLVRARKDLSHFYCQVRRSNRTDNGLLKRKFTDAACEVFKAG